MISQSWLRSACLIAVVWSASGAIAVAADGSAAMEYNRDVRPILSDKCFRCHGPDSASRQADLRLDQREAALRDRDGARAIVPGKADESEVMRRLTTSDSDERMPPAESGQKLTEHEIETIRRWIDAGANYQAHWSLIPPQPLQPPHVDRSDWPKNGIDRFILQRLEQSALTPSPEADKPILLRRLSLDLTGLPPSLDDLDAFLADDSPAAYERVVDRLLASPHYGERMALEWLDLARYADTNGYFSDLERQIWRWRDWVIAAFNRNQPYDQFTIEQLAGDLLPGATTEQMIATGLHRNHPVTNESGVIDEEYRVEYVGDRTETTAAIWLGLTLGCARCHDHKFDAISQRDYYQLFAFFNNVPEQGLVTGTANPAPVLQLMSGEEKEQLAQLDRERVAVELAWKETEKRLQAPLLAWQVTAHGALPALSPPDTAAWFDFSEAGADHTGRNAAAKPVDRVRYEKGIRGQAALLDNGGHFEFQTNAALDRNTPFTVSAWIRPAAAQTGCLLSKIEPAGDLRGFEMLWYRRQIRVNLVHRWAESALELITDNRFSPHEWHHVAVVHDGSGKAAGMQVYLDAIPQAVKIERDNLSGSLANDEPWRIGRKDETMGFDGLIDEVQFVPRALRAGEVTDLYWAQLVHGALAVPAEQRTKQQSQHLLDYYLQHVASSDDRQAYDRWTTLEKQRANLLSGVETTMVMQELSTPRETHLLGRGQYDQPGEIVLADVPSGLPRLSESLPRNRLGLAQWLVDPAHPLTARVAVNRLWQQFFGVGLVKTVNDFGSQGETPSHLELLDWLAMEFVRSGWDVKALQRQIVMSAAYRQSSKVRGELLERDPDNRLVARGPRFRLPAELIRDQALAISGIVTDKIGGPSVKPYQPAGLWEAVSYNGDQTYVQDHGAALYRRSLYTYWKRQSPPPALLAFDAPTRETCVVRRSRTNTPLQALVLLNDTTYIEVARVLAQHAMQRTTSRDDRLRYAFRRVTCRWPEADEASALLRLFEQERSAFAGKPQAAEELLSAGEWPRDRSLDPLEHAAWTNVMSVLLNLDETVTRP
jgi:cytochrome c553